MSEIFTYQKLYRAYLDCRKTKRKTANALKFELDMERGLARLLADLTNRTYIPGRSTCFVVINPTVREIFAADFRDRIVHHLLINEIEAMGEAMLIHDSYACRKGKGTHKAVARLQEQICKITENQTKNCYYMQLDISGFFMSIDHDVLYSVFETMILKQKKAQRWKNELLWLYRVIIYHKPTSNFAKKVDYALFTLVPLQKSLFGIKGKQGLPIGNYSSQFSGNLYLNGLDHYIKRELGCKYYVRYVDDLVILGHNIEQLAQCKIQLELFLAKNIKMSLNEKKTKLQPIEAGVDFLGYFIKPDYSLVRRRVVKSLRTKLESVCRDNKEFTEKEVQKILPMINSYYGHFRGAESYNLRKSIYENHLGGLKNWLEPAVNLNYLKLKTIKVIAQNV